MRKVLSKMTLKTSTCQNKSIEERKWASTDQVTINQRQVYIIKATEQVNLKTEEGTIVNLLIIVAVVQPVDWEMIKDPLTVKEHIQ